MGPIATVSTAGLAARDRAATGRGGPAEVGDVEARRTETTEDPWRTRLMVIATLVALAGVILVNTTSGAISGQMSLWLVHGVAVPVVLVVLRPRLAWPVLILVLAFATLLPAGRTITTIIDPPEGQLSGHDGGVIVTRAAAEDVVDGQNPYASDFSADLPPEWQQISVDGSPAFDNPISSVYPYLPGAFLAMAPLQLVAGQGSMVGDPRWVMLATFVVAAVAIARAPVPNWGRVAALFAFTGPIVSIHLSFGTNDTWAASLVVLAALALDRRPRLAGVLLALAISVKFLVLPPVVLWLAWRWRRRGLEVIRPLWTLPVALVATCLPFLVWSPGDFLNDTLLFWLGRSEVPFPASGFGLAARAPGLVQGPVLVAATVAFAAAGVGAAAWLVRRLPVTLALPPAAALCILGLLIPARTFQGNYLVLVVGLLTTGWLALAQMNPDDDLEAARVEVDRPAEGATGAGLR